MEAPIYERTIELGTIAGDEYGYSPRTRLPVTVTIEIRPTEKGPELSIQGSVWKPRRDDILSGGQNYDTIAAAFPRDAKVQRIVEVWRRWHLNGMRAGCEHQRDWPTGEALDNGKLAGWVYPSEHPKGLLTKRCDVCGYRYGSAWLHEPLPAAIIDEVKGW